MEGQRFIQTIRLDSILSYGPGTAAFPLEPLNVLIGPNASGKSNFIDALSILAGASVDLQAPILRGGGVNSWLWKGAAQHSPATIDVTLTYPMLLTTQAMPIRYRLSFSDVWGRFQLVDEAVESERPLALNSNQPYVYYSYRDGQPVINVRETGVTRNLQREDVIPDQSILSQRRDSFSYPELTNVATLFAKMFFYGEWQVGNYAPPRLPQQTDLIQDVLLSDASNLSLVLSDLMNKPHQRQQVLEHMREFHTSFREITTHVSGGTVQTFFHEKGLHHPIPTSRLSDGTLRFLCLLVVLCHPNPPSIICIEEPELGLHPDIIPEVAKLLVEASSRSQIFVTTHSDILVDALTDVPEAVIVCEKVDGATQLRRLDADDLKPWLEEYRLGELWTRGRFGGNRW